MASEQEIKAQIEALEWVYLICATTSFDVVILKMRDRLKYLHKAKQDLYKQRELNKKGGVNGW